MVVAKLARAHASLVHLPDARPMLARAPDGRRGAAARRPTRAGVGAVAVAAAAASLKYSVLGRRATRVELSSVFFSKSLLELS